MEEPRDHLFFEFVFSSEVWGVIFFNLGKSGPIILNWPQVVQWGSVLTRNTAANVITKLALQSSVYQIWVERNARLHTQTSHSVEVVVKLIKQDVRNIIYSKPKLMQQTLTTTKKHLSINL